MKILLGYNQHWHQDRPVQSYAGSFYRELWKLGHEVTAYGAGHELERLEDIDAYKYDLLIEVDSGRDLKGRLSFQQHDHNVKIPTAVWFVDSHGHPDMHRRMARHYGFIFFAVWDKRDIFAKHSEAHWLPNATDFWWFGRERFKSIKPDVEFGFFGSKGGLNRADPLKKICKKNYWSYEIRQINKPWKHMWPATGEAMRACQILFNHGQKHDAPNLRVIESMAVGRPLITDTDPRSGMNQLFTEGEHYFGYEAYSYEGLEEQCKYVLDHPTEAAVVAEKAHGLVLAEHQIQNRVKTMMEVIKCGGR